MQAASKLTKVTQVARKSRSAATIARSRENVRIAQKLQGHNLPAGLGYTVLVSSVISSVAMNAWCKTAFTGYGIFRVT